MQEMAELQLNEETLIVHSGKKAIIPPGELSRDAVPAIHPTTSYIFDSAQKLLDVSRGETGYVYRRYGNENTEDLAEAMCQFENASQGICVSTGMAAVSTAFIAAGVLEGNKKILGLFFKCLFRYL